MKEIFITSSVLILVLLLLRLVFAKKVSRGLIYGAWILVALRLLIPVQIGQVDFSVLTMAKPQTQTVTEVSELGFIGQNERQAQQQVIEWYIGKDQSVFTPEVQQRIEAAIQDEMPKEEIAEMISKGYDQQDIYVYGMKGRVTQQVQELTDFVSLGQIATIVWLVGVAVMAVWFAAVNLRYNRVLRRNAQELDWDIPIPVFVTENVVSPCLAGLFRPAIYLTPESADDEQACRHVLAHEVAHYRHGDHIWALARCVCLCIYWFHPLVWVAAYISRRDCELACDERALKQLGDEERVAYGKTLLDVVSRAAEPANLLHAATAMFETKKQLKERVHFVVKKSKISVIAVVCMVLVCAIVVGCTATGTKGEPLERNPGT